MGLIQLALFLLTQDNVKMEELKEKITDFHLYLEYSLEERNSGN